MTRAGEIQTMLLLLALMALAAIAILPLMRPGMPLPPPPPVTAQREVVASPADPATIGTLTLGVCQSAFPAVAQQILAQPSKHLLVDHAVNARRLTALTVLKLCAPLEVRHCVHPEHGEALMVVCRGEGGVCAVGFVSLARNTFGTHTLITAFVAPCRAIDRRIARECSEPVNIVVRLLSGW